MEIETRPGEERDPELERAGRRIFLQAIPYTFVANCIIAGFLTFTARQPLRDTLVYSHCIGFSILFLHLAGHRLRPRVRLPEWLITPLALPLGCAIGILLAWWVLTGTLRGHLETLPFALVSALVAGGAATYYFWSRARLAIAEALRRRDAQERAEAARRLAEAELRLLQAQIEPHFLFNTLSNVVSLVDGDPPRAKRMLLNLTSYLRGSLRRTRADQVTVREELDLLRAYLEIQAVRMGARLDWSITCPGELEGLPLSPLLLQPLVENAVEHGLEPRPGGGRVAVSVAREGEALVLEVRDDGVGLDPRRPAGVGLANVRGRIEAVTAGRGALTLLPRAEGGLCARIVLPLPALRPAGAGAPATGTGRPPLDGPVRA